MLPVPHANPLSLSLENSLLLRLVENLTLLLLFPSPQENAHFSICESLIAAIELMKCNMTNRQLEEEEEDSDKEIQELKQKIRIRRQQIRTRHLHPAYPEISSDSGCFLPALPFAVLKASLGI